MKKIFLGLALLYFFPAEGQEIPRDHKLIFEQTFEDPASISRFMFTQPSKWLVGRGKEDGALEFTGKSDYEPPFRSPHTIGLIGDVRAGSFILEADLLQTGEEYGHRDMCIIFGLQDSSHFYYSHIASRMDDNAHQVMIVNGAPRRKISSFVTSGVDWGLGQWHRVRIERNISTGTVKVFFDGSLIQESEDKTFGKGFIGFGSFDDSGKVDNIRIWSPDAERKDVRIFGTK